MKVREKLVQDLKKWYVNPMIEAGMVDDIVTEFTVLNALQGELKELYFELDEEDPVFDLYRTALNTHLRNLKYTILDTEL